MRQGSHSSAPFISLQSLFAVKTVGLGGHSCEAAVANVVAEPFWVKGVLVTVPFHVRELRTRSNQNRRGSDPRSRQQSFLASEAVRNSSACGRARAATRNFRIARL